MWHRSPRTLMVSTVACLSIVLVGCSSSEKPSPDVSSSSSGSELVEIVEPPSPSDAASKVPSRESGSPLSNVLPSLPPTPTPKPSSGSPTPSGGSVVSTALFPSGCPATPVYIVGDSLTDPSGGAAGKYAADMFAAKGIPAKVFGKIGMSTGQITGSMYQQTLGSSDAQSARTWVIAMGTNDSGSGFSNKVRQVMDDAGSRTVFWVNISRPSTSIPGPAGDVNAAIRNASNEYSNLYVIDYASAVASEPQRLGSDRIHLANGSAYKWRATMYLAPWRNC